MVDFLNQNKVVIGLAMQILIFVFGAGILYQRMRSLEKTVCNGITDRQNRQADIIETHKVALGKIEERCMSRKEWLDSIERKLERLSR